MSPSGYRKQRRRPSTRKEDVQVPAVAAAIQLDSTGDDSSTAEISDGPRDEFYETADQLSLSYHRLFALIRELDGQTQTYDAMLQPEIRSYIAMRLQLGSSSRRPGLSSSPHLTAVTVEVANQALGSDNMQVSQSKTLPVAGDAKPLSESTTTQKRGLPRISWLMAQIVQASEEKESLAQAAYGSVDRQIRLLDQVIQEQANALGLSPILYTPPPETGHDEELAANFAAPPDVPVPDARRSKRKQNQTGRRHSLRGSSTAAQADADEARTVQGLQAGEHSIQDALTAATQPTQGVVLPANDVPIDPHEPRYCYCRQISWGEMIACDGKRCQIEWFHLGCVGLNAVPKHNAKWYCPDCEKRLRRT